MTDNTIDYNVILKNRDKEFSIEEDSADSLRLGEILGAIGYDKEKSKFCWQRRDMCTQIMHGHVVFKNGVKVTVGSPCDGKPLAAQITE